MDSFLPEVFIIESLRFDDEEEGLFEGKILSQILNMHEKRCKYFYIRTKKELIKVLELFEKSKYRYLHLSCHGGAKSMATTLDSIKFDELGEIVRPHLENRRLFVSACKMVNDNLAKAIIPTSKCYSVIGPNKPVDFTDSAIFWSSLYHLMFTENSNAMKRTALLKNIRNISKLFKVDISYFAINQSNENGYEGTHFNGK